MSARVSPLLFRSGYFFKTWKSQWFSDSNYTILLFEDNIVHQYLDNYHYYLKVPTSNYIYKRYQHNISYIYNSIYFPYFKNYDDLLLYNFKFYRLNIFSFNNFFSNSKNFNENNLLNLIKLYMLYSNQIQTDYSFNLIKLNYFLNFSFKLSNLIKFINTNQFKIYNNFNLLNLFKTLIKVKFILNNLKNTCTYLFLIKFQVQSNTEIIKSKIHASYFLREINIVEIAENLNNLTGKKRKLYYLDLIYMTHYFGSQYKNKYLKSFTKYNDEYFFRFFKRNLLDIFKIYSFFYKQKKIKKLYRLKFRKKKLYRKLKLKKKKNLLKLKKKFTFYKYTNYNFLFFKYKQLNFFFKKYQIINNNLLQNYIRYNQSINLLLKTINIYKYTNYLNSAKTLNKLNIYTINSSYNLLSKYISFYLVTISKLQSNYKLLISIKKKLYEKQKRYFLFFLNQFKFNKKLKFTKLETTINSFIFKKKTSINFNFMNNFFISEYTPYFNSRLLNLYLKLKKKNQFYIFLQNYNNLLLNYNKKLSFYNKQYHFLPKFLLKNLFLYQSLKSKKLYKKRTLFKFNFTKKKNKRSLNKTRLKFKNTFIYYKNKIRNNLEKFSFEINNHKKLKNHPITYNKTKFRYRRKYYLMNRLNKYKSLYRYSDLVIKYKNLYKLHYFSLKKVLIKIINLRNNYIQFIMRNKSYDNYIAIKNKYINLLNLYKIQYTNLMKKLTKLRSILFNLFALSGTSKLNLVSKNYFKHIQISSKKSNLIRLHLLKNKFYSLYYRTLNSKFKKKICKFILKLNNSRLNLTNYIKFKALFSSKFLRKKNKKSNKQNKILKNLNNKLITYLVSNIKNSKINLNLIKLFIVLKKYNNLSYRYNLINYVYSNILKKKILTIKDKLFALKYYRQHIQLLKLNNIFNLFNNYYLKYLLNNFNLKSYQLKVKLYDYFKNEIISVYYSDVMEKRNFSYEFNNIQYEYLQEITNNLIDTYSNLYFNKLKNKKLIEFKKNLLINLNYLKFKTYNKKRNYLNLKYYILKYSLTNLSKNKQINKLKKLTKFYKLYQSIQSLIKVNYKLNFNFVTLIPLFLNYYNRSIYIKNKLIFLKIYHYYHFISFFKNINIYLTYYKYLLLNNNSDSNIMKVSLLSTSFNYIDLLKYQLIKQLFKNIFVQNYRWKNHIKLIYYFIILKNHTKLNILSYPSKIKSNHSNLKSKLYLCLIKYKKFFLKSNMKYYLINNNVSINVIINKLKHLFFVLFSNKNNNYSNLINKINYLLKKTYLFKFPKFNIKTLINYYFINSNKMFKLNYNKLVNLFSVYNLNHLLKQKAITLIKKRKNDYFLKLIKLINNFKNNIILKNYYIHLNFEKLKFYKLHNLKSFSTLYNHLFYSKFIMKKLLTKIESYSKLNFINKINVLNLNNYSKLFKNQISKFNSTFIMRYLNKYLIRYNILNKHKINFLLKLKQHNLFISIYNNFISNYTLYLKKKNYFNLKSINLLIKNINLFYYINLYLIIKLKNFNLDSISLAKMNIYLYLNQLNTYVRQKKKVKTKFKALSHRKLYKLIQERMAEKLAKTNVNSKTFKLEKKLRIYYRNSMTLINYIDRIDKIDKPDKLKNLKNSNKIIKLTNKLLSQLDNRNNNILNITQNKDFKNLLKENLEILKDDIIFDLDGILFDFKKMIRGKPNYKTTFKKYYYLRQFNQTLRRVNKVYFKLKKLSFFNLLRFKLFKFILKLKKLILKEKMKIKINWIFKNSNKFFFLSKRLFKIKNNKNLSSIVQSFKKLKFNSELNNESNSQINYYSIFLKKIKFLLKFDLYKLINFIYFRLSLQNNNKNFIYFIQFINYLNKYKLKLISKYNLVSTSKNYKSNIHINYLHYLLKNDLQKTLYINKNKSNNLTELITNFKKQNQYIRYSKKSKHFEQFKYSTDFENLKTIRSKHIKKTKLKLIKILKLFKSSPKINKFYQIQSFLINYNNNIYLIKKHNPFFKTILKQNIFNYIYHILNSNINIKYNPVFHKYMFKFNYYKNQYQFLNAQFKLISFFKDKGLIFNEMILNYYTSQLKIINLKVKYYSIRLSNFIIKQSSFNQSRKFKSKIRHINTYLNKLLYSLNKKIIIKNKNLKIKTKSINFKRYKYKFVRFKKFKKLFFLNFTNIYKKLDKFKNKSYKRLNKKKKYKMKLYIIDNFNRKLERKTKLLQFKINLLIKHNIIKIQKKSNNLDFFFRVAILKSRKKSSRIKLKNLFYTNHPYLKRTFKKYKKRRFIAPFFKKPTSKYKHRQLLKYLKTKFFKLNYSKKLSLMFFNNKFNLYRLNFKFNRHRLLSKFKRRKIASIIWKKGKNYKSSFILKNKFKYGAQLKQIRGIKLLEKLKFLASIKSNYLVRYYLNRFISKSFQLYQSNYKKLISKKYKLYTKKLKSSTKSNKIMLRLFKLKYQVMILNLLTRNFTYRFNLNNVDNLLKNKKLFLNSFKKFKYLKKTSKVKRKLQFLDAFKYKKLISARRKRYLEKLKLRRLKYARYKKSKKYFKKYNRYKKYNTTYNRYIKRNYNSYKFLTNIKKYPNLKIFKSINKRFYQLKYNNQKYNPLYCIRSQYFKKINKLRRKKHSLLLSSNLYYNPLNLNLFKYYICTAQTRYRFFTPVPIFLFLPFIYSFIILTKFRYILINYYNPKKVYKNKLTKLFKLKLGKYFYNYTSTQLYKQNFLNYKSYLKLKKQNSILDYNQWSQFINTLKKNKQTLSVMNTNMSKLNHISYIKFIYKLTVINILKNPLINIKYKYQLSQYFKKIFNKLIHRINFKQNLFKSNNNYLNQDYKINLNKEMILLQHKLVNSINYYIVNYYHYTHFLKNKKNVLVQYINNSNFNKISNIYLFKMYLNLKLNKINNNYQQLLHFISNKKELSKYKYLIKNKKKILLKQFHLNNSINLNQNSLVYLKNKKLYQINKQKQFKNYILNLLTNLNQIYIKKKKIINKYLNLNSIQIYLKNFKKYFLFNKKSIIFKLNSYYTYVKNKIINKYKTKLIFNSIFYHEQKYYQSYKSKYKYQIIYNQILFKLFQVNIKVNKVINLFINNQKLELLNKKKNYMINLIFSNLNNLTYSKVNKYYIIFNKFYNNLPKKKKSMVLNIINNFKNLQINTIHIDYRLNKFNYKSKFIQFISLLNILNQNLINISNNLLIKFNLLNQLDNLESQYMVNYYYHYYYLYYYYYLIKTNLLNLLKYIIIKKIKYLNFNNSYNITIKNKIYYLLKLLLNQINTLSNNFNQLSPITVNYPIKNLINPNRVLEKSIKLLKNKKLSFMQLNYTIEYDLNKLTNNNIIYFNNIYFYNYDYNFIFVLEAKLLCEYVIYAFLNKKQYHEINDEVKEALNDLYRFNINIKKLYDFLLFKFLNRYVDFLIDIYYLELNSNTLNYNLLILFNKKLKSILKLIKSVFILVRISDNFNIKGMRIKYKGRKTRKVRADTKFFSRGKMSLNCLLNRIDYYYKPAIIKYGAVGVKVFIYKENEHLSPLYHLLIKAVINNITKLTYLIQNK